MEPLPILPCGVSCQGANGGWACGSSRHRMPVRWNRRTSGCRTHSTSSNGQRGSCYQRVGQEARRTGHPKPFGLKYLGLGNEEKISPEFAERFRYIYKQVREAHPDIVIVGTAGPGSHPGNPDYDEGWKLAGELQMPWPKACICCMWSLPSASPVLLALGNAKENQAFLLHFSRFSVPLHTN